MTKETKGLAAVAVNLAADKRKAAIEKWFEHGYQVFTLSPNNKIPKKGAASGWKHAVSSMADLEKIADFGSDNFGVLLKGAELNGNVVVVLDIDIHDYKENGMTTLATHRPDGEFLPQTYIEGTPHNGSHFFVTIDKTLANQLPNTLQLFGKGSGVELKTNDIVSSPSMIDGKEYTIDSDSGLSDIAPLPEWILDEVRTAANKGFKAPHTAATNNTNEFVPVDDEEALNAINDYIERHTDDLQTESDFAKFEMEIAGAVVNKEISYEVANESMATVAEVGNNPKWSMDNQKRLNAHIKQFNRQGYPHQQLPFVKYFGIRKDVTPVVLSDSFSELNEIKNASGKYIGNSVSNAFTLVSTQNIQDFAKANPAFLTL